MFSVKWYFILPGVAKIIEEEGKKILSEDFDTRSLCVDVDGEKRRLSIDEMVSMAEKDEYEKLVKYIRNTIK